MLTSGEEELAEVSGVGGEVIRMTADVLPPDSQREGN